MNFYSRGLAFLWNQKGAIPSGKSESEFKFGRFRQERTPTAKIACESADKTEIVG